MAPRITTDSEDFEAGNVTQITHRSQAGCQPKFPFSSPEFDSHPLRSAPSSNSLHSAHLFASQTASIISLADDESGHTSGQDEFHLERYSRDDKVIGSQPLAKPSIWQPQKRGHLPALSLVTNFTLPNQGLHEGNICLNQVVTLQPSTGRNWARSIISQKGVQDVQPQAELKVQRAFVSLKDLTNLRKQKTRPAAQKNKYMIDRHQISSPSIIETHKIPIGIWVPEQDAANHLQTAGVDSALDLRTPVTPAIIITPAQGQDDWESDSGKPARIRKRPASSVYSATTPGQTGRLAQYDIPPLPVLSIKDRLYGLALGKQTSAGLPGANYINTTPDINNDDNATPELQPSADSDSHVLPCSVDTARPKSQGWWNLMLSPMLSRSGTMKSRPGQSVRPGKPPVLEIPVHERSIQNDNTLPQLRTASSISPTTDPSPETPRRQGLASSRESTWSRWTELEQERELAQQTSKGPNTSEREKCEVGMVDDLQVLENPTDSNPFEQGSAAEYYHACAVEDITGVPYFECINHSCSGKTPEFVSIYDRTDKETPTLGNPFDEGPTKSKEIANVNEQAMSQNQILSPITPSLDDDDQLSPQELSPNVRQASTAAVVKARTLDSSKNVPLKEPVTKFEDTSEKSDLSTQLPPYTAPRHNGNMPNIAAIVPSGHQLAIPSPAPISPEAQKTMNASYDISMTWVVHMPVNPRPMFIDSSTSYPELPARLPTAPVTSSDIHTERQIRESLEHDRQQYEKEDAAARKLGGLWRGRGCIPNSGCFGRSAREGRMRRRWIVVLVTGLTLLVIVCIVLATKLTRHADNTPIQNQWLNLTGFPPMPTGISTIAAPNLVDSENRCSAPTSLWSCAVPKEYQASIAPNDPSQPNFRFEIRFRNGTVPSNLTIPRTSVRKLSARQNDPFTNDLFVPNPQPPDQADQIFLGNTTDDITEPFNGEQTPFFITFMSTVPAVPPAYNSTNTKLLLARQNSSASILNAIPPPATGPDGSAAPASLLPTNPFPISQPVRLYNRGLDDEHYGFYVYYDKSIFLSGITIQSDSTVTGSNVVVEADQDGGSTKQAANAICTWAQTRFLVKIFTNGSFGGALLTKADSSVSEGHTSKKNTTSSAADFTQPGSFPYPATIVLDRHGGNIDRKAIYCYGVTEGQIVLGEKTALPEIRSFGGQLINSAPTIGDSSNSAFDDRAGGIDGGIGGCGCTWQNWK